MKTITYLVTTTSTLLLILALQSFAVHAEQVKMYNQPPSAAEMGKILFGSSSSSASASTGSQKSYSQHHARKHYRKSTSHKRSHRKSR